MHACMQKPIICGIHAALMQLLTLLYYRTAVEKPGGLGEESGKWSSGQFCCCRVYVIVAYGASRKSRLCGCMLEEHLRGKVVYSLLIQFQFLLFLSAQV